MSETKPRDLTAEELSRLAAPANRGTESVPVQIPPGAQIPVELELLDPTGGITSASVSPQAGPSDLAASVGAVAMKRKIPNPPRAKKRKRG